MASGTADKLMDTEAGGESNPYVYSVLGFGSHW
jgi:hypothetical protein